MELSSSMYTCAAGDMFDSIAFALWQNESYAALLMEANPEYCGTLVFTGGEKLYLPVIDEEKAAADTLPETAPWRN